MKDYTGKCLVVIFLALTIVGLWNLYHGSRFHQKESFLNELVDSWNGFKAEYRADINNIDTLRDNLRALRQERDGWEKIAFEFWFTALDYKMKYKECYTDLGGWLVVDGSNRDEAKEGDFVYTEKWLPVDSDCGVIIEGSTIMDINVIQDR